MKCIKKKVILSLIALLFIGIYIYNQDTYKESRSEIIENESEIEVPEGMILNPMWLEYNTLSDQEKATWEVIPEQFLIEYVYDPDEVVLMDADETPSKYDLRDVDGVNYVTPIKNQSSLGLCWAFASVASLESNILITGLRTPDNPAIFSERQIDYVRSKATDNLPDGKTGDENKIQVYKERYNPYGDDRIGNGGSFLTAMKYMTYGVSPVKQEGFWSNYFTDHRQVNLKDVYTDNMEYVVTEYIDYTSLSTSASEEEKVAWREMVQDHIMHYGALNVSSQSPSSSSIYSCFVEGVNTRDGLGLVNSTDDCISPKAPEGKRSSGSAHNMAIIGWDDDYVQSYCAFSESGTTRTDLSEDECTNQGGTYRNVHGAWLVKNSWGASSSAAIVHISYDSPIKVYGVKKVIEKNYDNIYSDMGLYSNAGSKTEGERKIIYATFIKKYEPEILKLITFNSFANVVTNYTAYVSSTKNKELIEVGHTTVSNPGRYSIEVNDVNLPDSDFTITIVSDNEHNAQSEYAFTKNMVSSSNEEKAFTIIDSYNDNLSIITRTYNMDVGEKLIYKVKDLNGTDVTSKFEIVDGYTVLGIYNNNFSKSSTNPASDGIYHIQTYNESNELLSTDILTIGNPLTGSGTENSPFLINNVSDLEMMFTTSSRFYTNTKYFKLNADLDFGNYQDFIINSHINFVGTFDGNNHIMKNMSETTYDSFMSKMQGTIKNIIPNAEIAIGTNLVYNGNEQNPVTVKKGSTILTKGTDYEITGLSKDTGSHNITITGKGNYKGSVKKTYTVGKKDITLAAKSITITYGDTANYPNFSTLVASQYTLSGTLTNEAPKLSGTLKSTWTSSSGIGTYQIQNNNLALVDNGTFKKENYNLKFTGGTITVEKADISNGTVTLEHDSYGYTGNQIKPNITSVKTNNNITLTANDYDVSYGENKQTNGTVTVTGKGNYKGSIIKTFTIEEGQINIPNNLKLKEEGNKKYITKIDINTKISGLNITSNSSIEYLDKKNNPVTNTNTKLYTGIKLKNNGIEYVLIVSGDVDGNGDLTYLDYVKVYNHIYKMNHPESNKSLLVNEALQASDMSEDERITYLDYVKIYNKIKELRGGN